MAQRTSMLTPARAARRPLPEEVAAYVRELIISGVVRPNEFLRLEPIAEALGVSNTPVREGLLALRSEGFVELVPRRGFVVAPFTQQDIRDLFWVRAQLSGELTARAAQIITAEQLSELEDNVAQYEAAISEGDTQAMADLARLFHQNINAAAQSERLKLLLISVIRHLPNRFYDTVEGHVSTTSASHRQLLEALRQHDPHAARSLIEAHVLEGADRLIESLEASGLWAEPDAKATAAP